MQNYYDILGLSQSANQAMIKRAYRKLALKYHPDRNPDSAEQFKRITEASNILKDPSKRAEYDRRLGYYAARSSYRSPKQGETTSRQRDTKRNYEYVVYEDVPFPNRVRIQVKPNSVLLSSALTAFLTSSFLSLHAGTNIFVAWPICLFFFGVNLLILNLSQRLMLAYEKRLTLKEYSLFYIAIGIVIIIFLNRYLNQILFEASLKPVLEAVTPLVVLSTNISFMSQYIGKTLLSISPILAFTLTCLSSVIPAFIMMGMLIAFFQTMTFISPLYLRNELWLDLLYAGVLATLLGSVYGVFESKATSS